MPATFRTQQEDVWTMIEAEKQRDRLIRRISTIAWTVTFVVLLVYAVIVGADVVRTLELVQVGVVGREAVFAMLMPLIKVVGAVALLIAVLSTVGVFLRLRTASLSEIQRVVNMVVLTRLMGLSVEASASDQVRALAAFKLEDLEVRLRKGMAEAADEGQKAHFYYAADLIERFLKDPSSITLPPRPQIPQGAPIGSVQ